MIEFNMASLETNQLGPKITILGVGGAGGNMLNAILKENIQKVKFVALNTDMQALDTVLVEEKIILGSSLTGGMGTGANPEIGKLAVEEDIDSVISKIEDSNIVFLLGGLGGGTGSGVLPVIAKILHEKGILSIVLVTKPFFFEGSRRMQVAQSALQKIEEYADTVITIPNQKLFESDNMENISLIDAFDKINKVMVDCIKAVTETIFCPGHINVDFADIKTTMTKMGKAVIGIGKGQGEKRALVAIQLALSSPLLEHNSLKGARSILLNIHGDSTLSLHEMNIIAGYVHDEVHPDAHIIVGSSINKSSEDDSITLTIIATGFEDQLKARLHNKNTVHMNQQINQYQNFTSQSNKNNFHHGNYNQMNVSPASSHSFQEKVNLENTFSSQKQQENFSRNIDIPTFLRNQNLDK